MVVLVVVPKKARRFAEEMLQGPGSMPFGARNGLACLLADARSTATTGHGLHH
jgi:hypothetical protein